MFEVKHRFWQVRCVNVKWSWNVPTFLNTYFDCGASDSLASHVLTGSDVGNLGASYI